MSLVANLETGQGGDLAFWGDLALVGHGFDDFGNDLEEKQGFHLVDISDPTRPTKLGQFECAMTGADVSVWGKLVILSSDVQARAENGDPAAHDACKDVDFAPVLINDANSFSGLRIVSIADPTKPVLLKNVKKDGPFIGSHTHTLVPDLKHRDSLTGRAAPRLIVYLNAPQGGQQVVEVPLRDPASAKWVETIDTAPAPGCHDVTVLVKGKLAACAGVTETQLWNISEPERPRVLSHIRNTEIESHHSTAFASDGKTLVIGDESASAIAAGECYDDETRDPKRGRLWFYDISDPQNPDKKSSFHIPKGRATGTCFVHQFNVVPMSGDRDVLVASWVTGGTTVIDFSDPAKPREIGYYVAEPEDPKRQRHSSTFASYWYDGHIYVNNALNSRGFDVLSVQPALPGLVGQDRMNPQTQEPPD